MSKENLKENIEICIVNLKRLAQIHCWNKISPNLAFIISDFNEFERSNFFEQRKVRNKINKSKPILSLDAVIEILNKEYKDLYDINLYIFKASKKETIIEIQYYRKSNFKPVYFEFVKNEKTMFHSKISKPYYVKNNNKFDINWELGGVRYLWNHFLAQISFKINTFKYLNSK